MGFLELKDILLHKNKFILEIWILIWQELHINGTNLFNKTGTNVRKLEQKQSLLYIKDVYRKYKIKSKY